MKPERWHQIEHLYNQALEMEESQRTAFLREACAGNDDLRQDLEGLLAQVPGSFLEKPALREIAHEFAATAAPSWIGRQVGNYQFVSLAGAGGMGEVYRARDTKLKREVAIKILPGEFSRDPDRISRFQREAQLLASLNHPNIAAIYDLEEAGGIRFLILELVEGETLHERLKRGAIPLDDALQIATQIAEGLAAAHERGIIHRDLKPANIKLTPEGKVKVLDFGLAKAFAGEAADVNLSNSPTKMTASMPGTILGTAAYMSPEQARGKVVDKRADVWAFGCVLYEMLTGRAPFARDTMTDTLAAILERDPAWSALPATTPAQVQRLLFHCLDKDPRARLHDIADARIEIEDVLRAASLTSAETAVVHPRQRSVRLLASIAVIASLVVIGALIAIGALMWNSRKAPRGETAPLRVSRTSIASSGAAAVNPNGSPLAITPDGRRVVYVGNKGTQLFVRPLDQVEPTAIATAAAPLNWVFVSPDGQSVGFVEGSRLKKVAITGGPAMTIADTGNADLTGAAWAPDDTIIFANADPATGLQRVPAAGGGVTVLTRPVPARGELDHLWPEMLPGGRAVLFTITATTGGPDAAQVAVLDLATGATRVLVPGGSHAHYVPSGHLVYTARGELRAVGFDLARLETRGTPVTVLPGLVTSRVGSGNFDVAAEGTLAYVDAPAATRTLVWVDRQNREEPLGAPALPYFFPHVSPDGTKVAVLALAEGFFVWDLARQTLNQLTPGGGQAPVWTTDGRRLLFLGAEGLSWQPADGTGAAEPLFGRGLPSGVTPDGTRVLFSPPGAVDMMMLALDGTRRVEPLIQTEFAERNGVVSPDGRWLAYESDNSGGFEIYVRTFPNVSAGEWLISTAGGTRPLWSPSGQELFYVAPDGVLMAVRADPRGDKWSSGSPEKVVEGPYVTRSLRDKRTYDVSTDGKKFLMVKQPANQAAPQIIVVQNWFEELNRIVPATR